MLELYEESAIEGMESGLFAYLAHPDLFMRSYPEFDRHCKLVSRHICRTAVRLNLPLEYNIGYEEYNDIHGITTIPHPDFWKIAAHEGCTAIIGVDAHNNQYLENPFYYNRATETLRKLGIKVTDRISFFNENNICNYGSSDSLIQRAHQYLTSHHQFLTKSCGSQMHV